MSNIIPIAQRRDEKAKKTRSPQATFSALHLAALRPVYEYAMAHCADKLPFGAMMISPASVGGVYIAACSNHVCAILHDPHGRATGPITLSVPDDAFDAASPLEPHLFTFGGTDTVEVAAPEWAQPGKVHVHEAGIIIGTRMPHPGFIAEEGRQNWPALFERCASHAMTDHLHGLDYHLTEGMTLDWTRLMAREIKPEMRRDCLTFDPALPLALQEVSDFLSGGPASGNRHRACGQAAGEGFITTNAEHPEFLGFWMPMLEVVAPQEVPEHFRKAGETS